MLKKHTSRGDIVQTMNYNSKAYPLINVIFFLGVYSTKGPSYQLVRSEPRDMTSTLKQS